MRGRGERKLGEGAGRDGVQGSKILNLRVKHGTRITELERARAKCSLSPGCAVHQLSTDTSLSAHAVHRLQVDKRQRRSYRAALPTKALLVPASTGIPRAGEYDVARCKGELLSAVVSMGHLLYRDVVRHEVLDAVGVFAFHRNVKGVYTVAVGGIHIRLRSKQELH